MIRLHAPLAPVITTLWPWLSVPTIDEDVLADARTFSREDALPSLTVAAVPLVSGAGVAVGADVESDAAAEASF